jgi:hypothetical protein
MSVTFKHTSLFLLTISVLTYFATATLVRAASISYPVIELKLQPGQTYTGTVDINFARSDPDTLYLSTERLETADITGQTLSYVVEPEENTLANWIKLNRTTVTRPATVTYTNSDNVVKVPYTINVPENAEPGAQYAVVVVRAQVAAPQSNAVGVANDVTLSILLTIDGEINQQGDLEWFKTKHNQLVFSRLPVEFEAKFINNGNVHIVPRGNIEVFQGGQKIDRISLNPKQERTLPTKNRVYERMWSEANIEELEKPEDVTAALAKLPQNFGEEVLYQAQNFRIGIFTAELQGFAGTKSYKASVSFLVIPWQLLLVIAGILILVIFTIRSQWQLRKQAKTKSLKP